MKGRYKRIQYSDPLLAGQVRVRTPMEAIYSGPIKSSFETHSSSCTTYTVSLAEVKRPGRGESVSSTGRDGSPNFPVCYLECIRTASSFRKVFWTLSKVLNFLKHNASKIWPFFFRLEGDNGGELKINTYWAAQKSLAIGRLLFRPRLSQ